MGFDADDCYPIIPAPRSSRRLKNLLKKPTLRNAAPLQQWRARASRPKHRSCFGQIRPLLFWLRFGRRSDAGLSRFANGWLFDFALPKPVPIGTLTGRTNTRWIIDVAGHPYVGASRALKP